jgi:hypothetical protein
MTNPDHRVYAAALLALCACDPAAAQDTLRASEEQLVNFAFATRLGSGVYSISGRTLQLYRLPFGYTLTEPDPVTLGLVDFKPQDVIDTGLPENLDTLSVVPGIELDFELTPLWHLVPFAEAGRALDLQGGDDATVYSFGVDATARKSFDAFTARLLLGASYAAVEPDATLRSDDMVLLEAGIEARRPLTLALSGHALDWGAYLFADYFVDRADEPLDKAAESPNRMQFEVGLTIGPQAQFTVWRLVFGQPF